MVDIHGEHVLLDGSLLVKRWNEKLRSRVLGRWSQTDKSSTCETTKILLINNSLEEIVLHASVTSGAILLHADFISGIVTYD
jgi:hypothetical protein